MQKKVVPAGLAMAAPLPAMSVALLARALFKRARRPVAPASFITEYTLDCLDRGALGRYNRLLGFPAGGLPITYYYLLAQRAHLASLLTEAFPFKVAGLVHVANELAELAPADPARAMRLVTEVKLQAPRDNGAVYCSLHTQGLDGAKPLFSCMSTYLAVRGARRATGSPVPAIPAGSPWGSWRLDAGSGRRYAAVSGDWNPIHLWPWSARLFGMRAPIIHGMHTMGRACALLEQAGGRRVRAISGRFKAPVALGASLALHAHAGAYTVSEGGRAVLDGSYSVEDQSLTSSAWTA